MNTTAFTLPFAPQWVFSGLAIIPGLALPESPIALVAQSNEDAARKAYTRLHGSYANAITAVDKTRAIIDHEKTQQVRTGDTTFGECSQATNKRRTFIIVLNATLQYLLGVSILANANYFLIMAGMSPTQSLQISQIGIGVKMVAIVLAVVFMSTFGRRLIVLWSSMATGIAFVAMGAAGFFQHDTRAVRFIGASILVAGSVSYLGAGAVWMVLNSEISSVRLRAKSSAISFMVNALCGVLFSITTPYMFNADAGNLGGKIGLIFAALSFLACGLTFMFLPETKAKSFEELDYLFEKRVPARACRKAKYGDY